LDPLIGIKVVITTTARATLTPEATAKTSLTFILKGLRGRAKFVVSGLY
jgi:hypothetical protein